MDPHGVNVKLVLRVGPGDDLRVNGSVDNSLTGEDASPQLRSLTDFPMV